MCQEIAFPRVCVAHMLAGFGSAEACQHVSNANGRGCEKWARRCLAHFLQSLNAYATHMLRYKR
jgi:hypothetical protein